MPRDILGEVEKHFWLTRSMARNLGISFTEAMAEGRLSAEGYAELVTRCRASACDGQCTIWLAQQQKICAAAPDFCANAAVLNALSGGSKPRM